ncbi:MULTISPECIES: EAL domain-containing protein [Sinorhizobium]|uniref:EAL domain-containing protein n=1 Tax=Sinorhizobium TaxID=28105 RepID=UPI001F1A9268|nr:MULTISPECIES: EAL domain-containing protein [Sinorhizobium]WOS67199.1 EAL domain-containing protein [Sinorhizobium fredii GR64]
MICDELDDIVRTALQAGHQRRIGFSVQQVNSVQAHHEVLYSECLARLVKVDGTVVTAGEFMPALEASGYAPNLDRHMLNLAVELLSNNASGPLGCNISTLNFSDSETRSMLYDQLFRHRSFAPRLVLEITERSPIAQLSRTAEFVQDIRSLGYRVAVDDFGASFSTPEVIFSMAVDIVKIDSFFVQSSSRPDADRMLHHMVGLASCVAPTIVVEGVETYNQLTLARAAGATHVQGYLLSEPTLFPTYPGSAGSAGMDIGECTPGATSDGKKITRIRENAP